jgi:hypothetical protein
MKLLDLSTIYTLKNIPHSVRVPAKVMRLIKEDSKKHGRKLGTHLTAILVEYLNTENENNQPL